MKRLLAIGLLAAASLATAVAAAASLGGVTTRTVAAGSGPVPACDRDGFTVSYAVAEGLVTGLTLGGVDPACAGGVLRLALVDGAGATVASAGPVTLDAGAGPSLSVAVVLASAPSARTPVGLSVSIAGP